MNVSNLFKGKKIDFTCPECAKKITVDASEIFKTNNSKKCPGCNVTINFNNDKSIRDVKKQLEKISKMFK